MAEWEHLHSDHPSREMSVGRHAPANEELGEAELRLWRGEVEGCIYGCLFGADLLATKAREPPTAATPPAIGTAHHAVSEKPLAATHAHAVLQLPFTRGSCIRRLITVEGMEDMHLQNEDKDVDEDRPEDACDGAYEGEIALRGGLSEPPGGTPRSPPWRRGRRRRP